MILYLLTQSQARGYDTFDSLIVCAESEDDARTITPSNYDHHSFNCDGRWCYTPEDVTVEAIGKAKPSMKRGVVLSSFRAG